MEILLTICSFGLLASVALHGFFKELKWRKGRPAFERKDGFFAG